MCQKFAVEERNEWSKLLVNFLGGYDVKIFKKKKKKKIVSSLGGSHKVQQKTKQTKKIVHNILPLNNVNVGSNHRMAGCDRTFSFWAERDKLVIKRKFSPDRISKNKRLVLTGNIKPTSRSNCWGRLQWRNKLSLESNNSLESSNQEMCREHRKERCSRNNALPCEKKRKNAYEN